MGTIFKIRKVKKNIVTIPLKVDFDFRFLHTYVCVYIYIYVHTLSKFLIVFHSFKIILYKK